MPNIKKNNTAGTTMQMVSKVGFTSFLLGSRVKGSTVTNSKMAKTIEQIRIRFRRYLANLPPGQNTNWNDKEKEKDENKNQLCLEIIN